MDNITAAAGVNTDTNTNTAAAEQTKNTDSDITSHNRTELDKNAFFKLLITQLRHQDPLKPMENKEFVSQMAQFSSLEQMQNMNESMQSFSKMQSLSQGASLIGKNIETYADDNDNVLKGVVTKVSYEDDKTYIELDGENTVPLDDVKTVY